MDSQCMICGEAAVELVEHLQEVHLPNNLYETMPALGVFALNYLKVKLGYSNWSACKDALRSVDILPVPSDDLLHQEFFKSLSDHLHLDSTDRSNDAFLLHPMVLQHLLAQGSDQVKESFRSLKLAAKAKVPEVKFCAASLGSCYQEAAGRNLNFSRTENIESSQSVSYASSTTHCTTKYGSFLKVTAQYTSSFYKQEVDVSRNVDVSSGTDVSRNVDVSSSTPNPPQKLTKSQKRKRINLTDEQFDALEDLSQTNEDAIQFLDNFSLTKKLKKASSIPLNKKLKFFDWKKAEVARMRVKQIEEELEKRKIPRAKLLEVQSATPASTFVPSTSSTESKASNSEQEMEFENPQMELENPKPSTSGSSVASAEVSILDSESYANILLAENVDDLGLVDSHFHLDRLDKKVLSGKSLNKNATHRSMAFSSMLERAVGKTAALKYPIKAAIASFCDQEFLQKIHRDKTLQEDLLNDPRISFVVGQHPTTVPTKGEAYEGVKGAMMNAIEFFEKHGKFAGLGEIGLDYSNRFHDTPSPSQQREFVQRCLQDFSEHTKQKCLVLHLRGKTRKLNHNLIPGVHEDMLDELQKAKYPADQHIQLHYFGENASTVDMWLQRFPNTYFSFSGSIFQQDFQAEGLRRVPRDRLLVETDAPYAPIMKKRYSSPIDVHKYIEKLSQLRKENKEELKAATVENAKRCFRLSL